MAASIRQNLKITKVTITDNEGNDHSLPIGEMVSLRMYSGLRVVPNTGMWKEWMPNGNNPFIIISGSHDLVDCLSQKILEEDIREFTDT